MQRTQPSTAWSPAAPTTWQPFAVGAATPSLKCEAASYGSPAHCVNWALKRGTASACQLRSPSRSLYGGSVGAHRRHVHRAASATARCDHRLPAVLHQASLPSAPLSFQQQLACALKLVLESASQRSEHAWQLDIHRRATHLNRAAMCWPYAGRNSCFAKTPRPCATLAWRSPRMTAASGAVVAMRSTNALSPVDPPVK
jgi:hypothetical protein